MGRPYCRPLDAIPHGSPGCVGEYCRFKKKKKGPVVGRKLERYRIYNVDI